MHLKIGVVVALIVVWQVAIISSAALKSKVRRTRTTRDVRLPKIAEQRLLVEINGIVYYFGVTAVLNFYEAEMECDNWNMTLISFETQEKYQMILNYLTDNPENDYWMWTSGQRLETTWRWSASGKNFSFTSWAPQQPDVNVNTPACMNFAGFGLGWEDDECDLWEMSFLCEEMYPSGTTLETTTTTTSTGTTTTTTTTSTTPKPTTTMTTTFVPTI